MTCINNDGNCGAYDASAIASYIIYRCARTGRPLCNIKLQIILYYAQAEFLVSTGRACFHDDITAGAMCPVVPEVYRRYCIYGGANIPSAGIAARDMRIGDEDMEVLNRIIDRTAVYSVLTLMEITRRQAPWKNARASSNRVISPYELEKYFSEN